MKSVRARRPSADVLAVAVLLALPAVYVGMTWARHGFWGDPGWTMQVSARVADGDVLYRDVCWIYGPLPVYALALLYRLLGTGVDAYSLYGLVLAALAGLLTYRAARFLLPMPLALLGTVAVFLGGQQPLATQWGGFFSYAYAYTGVVSLGGVLGLACVVCLLSAVGAGLRPAPTGWGGLRRRELLWLVIAGLAAGGTLLTKPEYALACLGTGVLVLGLRGLFVFRRRAAVVALAIYGTPAAVVASVGYGLLAYHAGGANVWAGVTGYGQADVLLHAIPPWGTPLSWAYIVGGLGAYLLLVVVLLGVGVPALRSARRRGLLLTVAAASLIAVALWGLAFSSALGIKTTLSWSSPLVEGSRLLWSPGTLLLAGLLIVLGVRWGRAWRRGQVVAQDEWSLAILAVYSALLAARSYFIPIGDFAGQYVDTLFPVLVYALVILLPRAAGRWTRPNLLRARALILVIAVLVAYGAGGFALNVARLSRPSLEVTTPRGLARIDVPDRPVNRAHVSALRYVVAHTAPGEPILVLGHALGLSGHYFLSGRRNPLRQDGIMPWMGSAPVDVSEILQRLEAQPPRLVMVFGEIQDDDPLVIRTYMEYYGYLGPIWQYVEDRYRLETVIREGESGYAIYVRTEITP